MFKIYLSNSISILSKTWIVHLSLFLFPFILYSQPTSLTFNASGSFTIPAGYIANINVQAWGGGGGGGNASDRSGGGGGGAFASRNYTNVTAGSFAVTIGQGGALTLAGGTSTFIRASYATTSAAGGSGASGNSGGNGGTTGASSGSVLRAGGSGGDGTNNGGGGGGGGSATSSANGSNGNDGSGTSGGAGGAGAGSGGRGGDEDGSPDAVAGNAPGGGGGGRGDDGIIQTSKAGAAGRIIVTVSFYWTTSQSMVVIGGGGSSAEAGCEALNSGVISTPTIMVAPGSRLIYKLGANAGEPVCDANAGTAPFEAEEGVGLFASNTSGGTQVYDSRMFTGAGDSNEPPNVLPSGSGCIYNNNSTTRYLTFKTINTATNAAALPSQDEELVYIAYEVLSGATGGCTNLPIQLSDFEVNLVNGKPQLEWSTFSEFNNNYFAVERSRNGKDFNEIAQVKGIGTSDKENHYTYTDLTPFKGINYYRIKQVDLDGNSNRHTTKSIIVPVDEISVFPTIFDHEVTLQIPPPYNKTVQWALYDALGNNLKTGQIVNSQATQQLSMTGLQSGSVYILAVFTEHGIETKKIVKF
ncbi:MAG: T9SS type A sorting domain-containing protein [Saprospiraceae bacterium]